MENPAAPPGKTYRYARPERERRFLLAEVPKGWVGRRTQIIDRYITGTQFRLRRTTETAGSRTEIYHKLTQKIASPIGGPGIINTLYIDRHEYAVFEALPAMTLSKVRLSIPPFGVDTFSGELTGLVLAEIEFETDEAMHEFHAPFFSVAEVTKDNRFTGGFLCTASRSDLLAALEEFGLGEQGPSATAPGE